ncbi:DUF72 domain-containing protein [Radiobacillus deserti]|uniref:DUF72 domain-containing protein n=1 Tax=Radiobacillus deserti TaxID=2594883 RepID=A0A516KG87_9BACI|nr:DUF72 domain-containing protein [Radiobacillus deserti]QDP40410.1 DUF72 domain-containing protein [Radiobacillus deserti]
MAIHIGLTGWGDHDTLYPTKTTSTNKLSTYSSYFPVVEVDTAFYAIQPEKNYQKWVTDTPDRFSFVIKAFQGMTGHDRQKKSLQEAKELFAAYKQSITPVLHANKLNCILFQFPPWFDVTKANIRKLRVIRELLPDLPLALEFRNRTWFEGNRKNQTIQFMKEEKWIHTICDEPQAGVGSIPTVLEPTSEHNTLVRFHGRNVHGWNRNGQADWRAVRFLYHYNRRELEEWASHLNELDNACRNVTVLFNNNSGGDAARNAIELMELLNITYEQLNPRQLDLFE